MFIFHQKIEEPGVVKMMSGISRIILGADPEHPEYDSGEIVRFSRAWE